MHKAHYATRTTHHTPNITHHTPHIPTPHVGKWKDYEVPARIENWGMHPYGCLCACGKELSSRAENCFSCSKPVYDSNKLIFRPQFRVSNPDGPSVHTRIHETTTQKNKIFHIVQFFYTILTLISSHH